MKADLKFGLEDMVRYFERNPASQIYRDFYFETHFGLSIDEAVKEFGSNPSATMQVGNILWLPSLIVDKLRELYSGATGIDKFSDEVMELSNLCDLRLVESPPYETIVRQVRNVVGQLSIPYIQELILLGLYRRSLDVALMDVYSIVAKNCPTEIKNKIHNDKVKPSAEYTLKFIQWLEIHPQDDNFTITEPLRNQIFRLFARIKNLYDIYTGSTPAPVKYGESERMEIFNHLNKVIVGSA